MLIAASYLENLLMKRKMTNCYGAENLPMWIATTENTEGCGFQKEIIHP